MNKLLNYIEERSSMSGCNTNKWNCDTFDYCDVCLEYQIKEHDKRIREQAIDEIYSEFEKFVKSKSKTSYYWTELWCEFMRICKKAKEGEKK